MSHVVAVQYEAITSLEALERAAAKLGCELVRGQTTHKWYGHWVGDYSGPDAAYRRGIDPNEYGKCQHAIRVLGNEQAYEVGLVPAAGGEGWQLVYDNWQGGHGLEAALGRNLDTLLMHYQLERAKLQAEALGYLYEESPQKDGSVTLTVYA